MIEQYEPKKWWNNGTIWWSLVLMFWAGSCATCHIAKRVERTKCYEHHSPAECAPQEKWD